MVLTRRKVDTDPQGFYEYLLRDRVGSTRDVVDHMRNIFGRVRSLVAEARGEDASTTEAFLAIMQEAINSPIGVTPDWVDVPEVLRPLSRDGLSRLFVDLSAPDDRRLFPSLAIRHAASEVFQEAHFELVRAGDRDLFEHRGPAVSSPVVRGGVHYTPAPLARSLVEQTLAQDVSLARSDRLVILDPACGSGAFLYESLRTLRRMGFSGNLQLIGRDVSPPAVLMARFVLRNASEDWKPKGGCDVDIAIGDSLTDSLPTADVVLMNPPFISWLGMSKEQRSRFRETLPGNRAPRGDLSMAFVTRGLQALRAGGAMGSLVPSSLLALDMAKPWRDELLDVAQIRGLASLGEIGLFRHAMVQVTMVTMRKRGKRGVDTDPSVLVAGNSSAATGNALRALRRDQATIDLTRPTTGSGWRRFSVSHATLRQRPVWPLTPPALEAAIEELRAAERLALVGETFVVREGVHTGRNAAFVLPRSEVMRLPLPEQKWFRPAAVNEAIGDGRIRHRRDVFYPYIDGELAIGDEATLEAQVPQYAARHLRPREAELRRRAAITRTGSEQWWRLSWHRPWASSTQPRLVAKHFGSVRSVAMDFDARFIVINCFAWFLKADVAVDGASVLTLRDILAAYAAILNSPVFVERLLSVYSPRVAGGQLNMSKRYVRHVPVPAVAALAEDEPTSEIVRELAELWHSGVDTEPDFDSMARLAEQLYGEELLKYL
ncbi:MAG: N-6 DNA methylase [Gammaproteobacteria bacterium]|nr:N-6 DNA methylase [Gammaproteobacteria bacterium]